MKFSMVLVLFVALLASGNLAAQSDAYGEVFFGSASQVDTGVDYGSDTSFGFWGGFPVSDMLALEVGYTNFGGPSFNDGFDLLTTETSAFNIGGRIQVPINETIGIHGRLGLALWEIEFGGDFVGSYDDSNVYFGIGGDVRISESTSIVVDYMKLDCEVSGVAGSLDITNFSVGLGFEF